MIWLTGLSGSGKTSLAEALCRLVKPRLPQIVVLDGDVIRAAFGNDLSYDEPARVVQIRRLQNMAKVLSDQGLVVIVAAVYSHPDLLAWNREHLCRYFEVYLDASLDTVRGRDRKGLYALAAQGAAANVVGVDIPWRAPTEPDLVINMDEPDPPAVLACYVAGKIPGLAAAMADPSR